MPAMDPILSGLLRGAQLPLLARPVLAFGVRIGLLKSSRLEVVLRYLDHYDEAINWWPPISLILFSCLLLLATPVLGIGGIVELIRHVRPAWIGIWALLLSVVCFWSPLFMLVLHYRQKISMLYGFAMEHRELLETVSRQSLGQLSSNATQLRDFGSEQLSRIAEGGSAQLSRLRRQAPDEQKPG